MSRDPAATYDLLERKQPHRLQIIHFARAIPGLAGKFSGRVPSEYMAQVDEDTVEVLCVCKPEDNPRCPRYMPVECSCGRWFLNMGADVRVADLRVD